MLFLYFEQIVSFVSKVVGNFYVPQFNSFHFISVRFVLILPAIFVLFYFISQNKKTAAKSHHYLNNLICINPSDRCEERFEKHLSDFHRSWHDQHFGVYHYTNCDFSLCIQQELFFDRDLIEFRQSASKVASGFPQLNQYGTEYFGGCKTSFGNI